jgi:hypothetical protein
LKVASIEQTKAWWTITVKTLLSIILSKAVPLQEFAFQHSEESMRLAVHASVLEHVSIYMTQLKELKSFNLGLAADVDQGG